MAKLRTSPIHQNFRKLNFSQIIGRNIKKSKKRALLGIFFNYDNNWFSFCINFIKFFKGLGLKKLPRYSYRGFLIFITSFLSWRK